MEYNEDQETARAIALSLQDIVGASHKPREIIDLVTDSEDDEKPTSPAVTRNALKPGNRPAAVIKTAAQLQSQPKPQRPQHDTSTFTSTFLSERAQLEKERIERQKRLRPKNAPTTTSDFVDNDNDDADDDDDVRVLDEPPSKRQRNSSSNGAHKGLTNTPSPRVSKPAQTARTSTSTSTGTSTPTPYVPNLHQIFWNGELRQTATQHAEPRKDGKPTFRLTEVLGPKSDLAFAIMSSYALDFAWIYEFFDRSVPVIMVAQPDASGQTSLKNVLPNWIRTTPFLAGGRGCMHMKFMLLFYKTLRLRVVISTANLVAHDWRHMENTVWLQDIPIRSKPISHDPKAPQDFPTVLQNILYSVNVQPALKSLAKDNHPDLPLKTIEELRMRWDWSNVKVHLVPSIAGRHEGWPRVIKTGHTRLMQVVRDMGLRTSKGKGSKSLRIECQGSSIGMYTSQWLNEFHWSARGESAEDWLDEPKKKREKLPCPPVNIVFPTKATVQHSALGEQGGGTIFCRRRQWAGKNFPREHFFDSRSKAGPVLMHSKMIIATFKEPSEEEAQEEAAAAEGSSVTEDDSDDEVESIQPAIGWAYIGSHNFTPSAWGNLSGSVFNPVLNITNYEVGIVFPLKNKESVDAIACFERPTRKYLTGKDEPWIQEESVYHQNV